MSKNELESLTPKEINDRLKELLGKLDENLEEKKQLVDRYASVIKKLEDQNKKNKQLVQEYNELMEENKKNRGLK